jgi:hypothetical protein
VFTARNCKASRALVNAVVLFLAKKIRSLLTGGAKDFI